MISLHHREDYIEQVKNAAPIEADFMVGLSGEEVEARVKDGFQNKTKKKVTKSYWQIFCDNFFSFFNMVYLIIAIMMIIADIGIDYFFFVIPVASNIIIGLITDIRARVLVDKLRLVTDPKVQVMRSKKEVSLSVDQLVLSDIMVLYSGDQICSDGIVINGKLSVDESLLTGESVAITKNPGSQVLSGSFVKSGKAYVRVNRVGIANYAEGLQDSAKEFKRPKSELKSSCLKIFGVTGALSLLFGLAQIVTWLIKELSINGAVKMEAYTDLMLSLSGSLVAMIPAGLYLLTSLTLGIGVVKLAKKKMNVQELYCIEMLARVDVVCFDKTGTLTDGKMAVKDLYNYSSFTDEDIKRYLGALILATNDQNATAIAIKNYAGSAFGKPIASIPFDSARKYSAVTLENVGTFVLGAPGFINAEKNEIGEARIDQLAKRGYRTMGLYFSKKPIKNDEIPAKNTLICVISLSDHIKEDAKKNIEWFKNNGVDVKIISGDNPITVSEIANEVGVPGAANYISMESVEDDEIPSLIKEYSVFGRVKPEQKALLVSALQAEGHKVAMTGDGVNDILALKTADCSIAMASGSSAARNVAHMVSVNNDFSTLPDVVGEGRRVINNLQRTASLFLSKTIFAVLVSAIFLISSWAGKSDYPFTTKNMMVWEIVTIGGGGFFLALQPSSERLEGSFLANVMKKALPAGIVEVLAAITFFVAALIAPQIFSPELSLAMAVIAFTTVSYFTLFRISVPLDLYRGIVCVFLLLCGVVFFALDYFVLHTQFGIDYGSFARGALPSWANALILFGVLAVILVFYILLDVYSDRFFGKRGIRKKEAK